MIAPQTSEIKRNWMLHAQDPARYEIAKRADALGIVGDPDKAVHDLGKITLADGQSTNAYVVHAIDSVITDRKSVVMIDRLHAPGQGLPALPSGLIDPLEGGGVETGIETGIREAFEEVGIKLTGGVRIGTRNMNRPYDVRIAQGDILKSQYGIQDGDIFMVSTQAVRYDVPDLSKIKLIAGDDAEPGSARCVAISDIQPRTVGIPNHADMVHEALAAYP